MSSADALLNHLFGGQSVWMIDQSAFNALLGNCEAIIDAVEEMEPDEITAFSRDLLLAARAEVRAEPAVVAWRLSRAALGVQYLHRASCFADPAGQNVLPEQNTVDLDASAHFWRDVLIARFAAGEAGELRRSVERFLRAFRGRDLPRVWAC